MSGAQLLERVKVRSGTSEMPPMEGVKLPIHGDPVVFVHQQPHMYVVGLVSIVGAGTRIPGLAQINQVHGAASEPWNQVLGKLLWIASPVINSVPSAALEINLYIVIARRR
jgi:hypothetical protein